MHSGAPSVPAQLLGSGAGCMILAVMCQRSSKVPSFQPFICNEHDALSSSDHIMLVKPGAGLNCLRHDQKQKPCREAQSQQADVLCNCGNATQSQLNLCQCCSLELSS